MARGAEAEWQYQPFTFIDPSLGTEPNSYGHMCRTYWNTNSLIKLGDKYIRIELNNAAPKAIVTRHSGELLKGFVTKNDEVESIECDSIERALKEAARLCEEAVHRGYYAYYFPVHGSEQLEWPRAKKCAEIGASSNRQGQ